MQYSTVLYSTVLYYTVQYCTIQYSNWALLESSSLPDLECQVKSCLRQYCTVQYCTVQYCTVQCTEMCQFGKNASAGVPKTSCLPFFPKYKMANLTFLCASLCHADASFGIIYMGWEKIFKTRLNIVLKNIRHRIPLPIQGESPSSL